MEHLTREQEHRIEALCHEHGTCHVRRVRTGRDGVLAIVRCDDGTGHTIRESGAAEAIRPGRWSSQPTEGDTTT